MRLSLNRPMGRPPCRPLFFAGLLLLAGDAASQIDPLVLDVVVSQPALNDDVILTAQSVNPAPDRSSPVGHGLLRFYGCITCHDLVVPPFRGRWGPDLDTVGSKTTSEWLGRFLRDPRAAQVDARMPRVTMEDSTRALIIDMLVSLETELPDPVEVAGQDGEALYARGDCRTCHRLDGAGGDRGPALDGLSGKIRKQWLTAYLLDPSEMIPNSRMPLFGWEEEEAAALATHLVGEGPSRSLDGPVDRERVYRGVSRAAQLGCFQCHRVRRFSRTLDLPDRESARSFITHHHEGNSAIRFPLTAAQAQSMTDALFKTAHERVSNDAFLDAFWQTPIPLQGSSPAAHDTLAARLTPQDCSTCHERQHREWQGSLHAAAMGPGVIGQLMDHAYSNAGFVGGCQDCHAPNAEQYASLPDDRGHGVNYQFDARLRDEGITCIACHVRAHARFGPPVSDRPPVDVWRGTGHGGANESTVYQSSEFCSACHQFVDGNRRMNGKLLQDTFQEWKSSPQASRGQTCQTCHMPDRSHRWLGIHDPSTVLSAIDVQVSLADSTGQSVAVIEVRNTGAGHHLPTYVTPKIFVNAVLVDAGGKPLEGSRQTRAIGREIILNSQESRELYDSRIPAGGVWSWRYAIGADDTASGVEISLEVFPDHFYARFFEDYDRSGLSDDAAEAIRVAGERSAESNYIIFHETFRFRTLPER